MSKSSALWVALLALTVLSVRALAIEEQGTFRVKFVALQELRRLGLTESQEFALQKHLENWLGNVRPQGVKLSFEVSEAERLAVQMKRESRFLIAGDEALSAAEMNEAFARFQNLATRAQTLNVLPLQQYGLWHQALILVRRGQTRAAERKLRSAFLLSPSGELGEALEEDLLRSGSWGPAMEALEAKVYAELPPRSCQVVWGEKGSGVKLVDGFALPAVRASALWVGRQYRYEGQEIDCRRAGRFEVRGALSENLASATPPALLFPEIAEGELKLFILRPADLSLVSVSSRRPFKVAELDNSQLERLPFRTDGFGRVEPDASVSAETFSSAPVWYKDWRVWAAAAVVGGAVVYFSTRSSQPTVGHKAAGIQIRLP